MEKTCLHCGGFFIVADRYATQSRFCRKKCVEGYRRAHQSEERRWRRRKPGKIYLEAPDRPPKASFTIAVCCCAGCGAMFASKQKKKVCSAACSTEYYNRRFREKYQAARLQNLPDRDCSECGELFSPGLYGRRRFCGHKCGKRFSTRLRKARERIAPGRAVEEFGCWEIYRRDGYMCQICGDKLNLAVHHSHNYSPTIDHIVPLSKGGSHTRANVQAAHRFCNSLKSDKAIDSMFFAINHIQGGLKSLSV